MAISVSGVLAASFAGFSAVAVGDPPASDVGIKTLSTRADLVSGGNVLVQITLKHENRNHPVAITLNGHDVSDAFQPGDAPNTLIGLVTVCLAALLYPRGGLGEYLRGGSLTTAHLDACLNDIWHEDDHVTCSAVWGDTTGIGEK